MKQRSILFKSAGVFLLILMLVLSGAGQTRAAPTVVASDMVNSTSLNLISYTDDPAIP
jgi:hypothetical protein